MKKNLNLAFEQKKPLTELAMAKHQIQVYMSLAEWMGSSDSDTTVQFQVKIVNSLLEQFKEITEAGNSLKSLHEFQNLAIEICGSLVAKAESKDHLQENILAFELHMTVMDLLEQTEQVVKSGEESNDPFTLIQLCKVIRKTLNWTPLGSPIVSMFIQAVKERAHWFDQKVLAQVKNLSGGLQQFELEMLSEMADTLLVCSGYLTEDNLKAGVEDNLYYLLGCGVESLQKAAYVLLRFIYENFIPPVEF